MRRGETEHSLMPVQRLALANRWDPAWLSGFGALGAMYLFSAGVSWDGAEAVKKDDAVASHQVPPLTRHAHLPPGSVDLPLSETVGKRRACVRA